MEKKVIDIMGEIDGDLFTVTEISKEEEDSLSCILNFDKIKEDARKGIHNEEESGVESERRTVSETTRRPFKIARWAVCAAAAVMLLGGSVAVAQHLDVFRTFLGIGAVIPEEEVTDVSRSVSKDGIKMTVDSVIAGKNDFVTLLTFELEDGGAFPENAELHEIWVDTDENGVEMAGYSTKLSEDRKQLISCIESSSRESMLGRTITATAEGVYTEEQAEKDLDVSLFDCFQKNPVRLALSEEDRNAAWNTVIYPKFEKKLVKQQKDFPVVMPLSEEYPDLSFAGVGILDGTLCIATYFPDDKEEDALAVLRTEAVVNKLVDSRTEEVYTGSYGSTTSSEYQGKGILVAEFDGLGEADLPYLKPAVTYIKRNILAEGPWEISFAVEDQGKDITVKPDMTVNTEKGEVVLTEANISPVGGYVIGEWSDAESLGGLPESYATKLSVATEDGDVWGFKVSGGSSFTNQEGKNCFKYIYELYEDANEDNRVFLSQDKLKKINKIILDNTEVEVDNPLSH